MRATLLPSFPQFIIHQSPTRPRHGDHQLERRRRRGRERPPHAVPGLAGPHEPILEFGRRLAYHGLCPTLVATQYVLSITPPPGAPFRVAATSDGFDAGGGASAADAAEYFSRLEAVGSETLRELLLSEAHAGRPVRVLVYDAHLSWARRVALAAAAFFSQPCAVDIVYGEIWAGRMALPATDGHELLARGALGVELGPEDMPPFTAVPQSEPMFLKVSISQFDGLEDADNVLMNSFRDLEPMVARRGSGGDEYGLSSWQICGVDEVLLPSLVKNDAMIRQRLVPNLVDSTMRSKAYSN